MNYFSMFKSITRVAFPSLMNKANISLLIRSVMKSKRPDLIKDLVVNLFPSKTFDYCIVNLVMLKLVSIAG